MDAARDPLVRLLRQSLRGDVLLPLVCLEEALVHTPTGYIITEWMPKPEFKDGSFGALPDAAPFHLGEARWLHTSAIAETMPVTGFAPDVDIKKYSDAMPTAVRDVTLANGNAAFATSPAARDGACSPRLGDHPAGLQRPLLVYRHP